MSELQALSWFKNKKEIALFKDKHGYRIHYQDLIVKGKSFLDVVILTKDAAFE